jgi:hypothetical protein
LAFLKSNNKARNICDFTLAALLVMPMLRDKSCFCTAFSDGKKDVLWVRAPAVSFYAAVEWIKIT